MTSLETIVQIRDLLPYPLDLLMSTELFQSDFTNDLECYDDSELLERYSQHGTIEQIKDYIQDNAHSDLDTWNGQRRNDFFLSVAVKAKDYLLNYIKEEGITSIKECLITDLTICEYRPAVQCIYEIDLEKLQSEFYEYLERTKSLEEWNQFIKDENSSRDGFWSWTENDGIKFINKLTDIHESHDNGYDRVNIHQCLQFILREVNYLDLYSDLM